MSFILKPRPPFDFELTAGFFSNDDAQIRKYEKGRYWQAVEIKNRLFLVTISSRGTIDHPELEVELHTNEEITHSDQTGAAELIKNIFNLDLDLNKFYKAMRKDKIVSKLTRELQGLKGPNNTTVFEGLICSIIEQQISLAVAFNLQKRLTKTFGNKLLYKNESYYSFPTPDALANANIEELRGCGLSTRKCEYIQDISRLVVDGTLDLERFKNYPDPDTVISELSEYRGIGAWTVELTMLRSMQRFDVIPADDLGLKRFVSLHYFNGNKVTTEEIRKLSTRWGAWKGLVAYYFLEADRLKLDLTGKT